MEILVNLEELNNKTIQELSNFGFENDELINQLYNDINDYSGIFNIKKHKSFKEYLSFKVDIKGGNITNEIIDEFNKIYKENNFKDAIKSLYSKDNYFPNSLDIILNSLKKIVKYKFFLLIEEVIKYSEKTLHDIEIISQLLIKIYLEEQQMEFNELRINYQLYKYALLELKSKLLSKDTS